MKATRKQPNSSVHNVTADQMKANFAAIVQHQQHLRDTWLETIIQTTAKEAAIARKRALAAIRGGMKMPENDTLKIHQQAVVVRESRELIDAFQLGMMVASTKDASLFHGYLISGLRPLEQRMLDAIGDGTLDESALIRQVWGPRRGNQRTLKTTLHRLCGALAERGIPITLNRRNGQIIVSKGE